MKKEIQKYYKKRLIEIFKATEERMKLFNLEKKTLAQELGIDQANLTKYFKGNTVPNACTFMAILQTVQTMTEAIERYAREELKKNQTKIFDGKK